MIRIEALTHTLGARLLFNGLYLSLETGSRLALCGPSGSGKTTLLSLIAGLSAPQQGVISLDGAPVSRNGKIIRPPHQRGIGLVPQTAALWPHMNVAQNVAFGLGGLPRDQARVRAAEAMARTGCAALANRKPDTLSGGEQRRVALARALAPAPSMLLLDEPLSNLDPSSQADLASLVATLARDSGATVIWVTHDPDEAAGCCPLRMELREGRLLKVPGC